VVTPVGVLGLQGDFDAHRRAVEEIGREARVVRWPAELDEVEGLIIPGGESTTLIKLLREMEFVEPLRRFHGAGRAIFGTCAGAILMARRVVNPEQFSLGLLDIEIERNAYGRQTESFEAADGRVEPALAAEIGPGPLEMVFIRAPKILVCGPAVQVLARHGADPVLVRCGQLLAGTFHPEMGRDRRVHRYFAGMAAPSAS
jgi:5'-phosphate synthase pdxT subunit